VEGHKVKQSVVVEKEQRELFPWFATGANFLDRVPKNAFSTYKKQSREKDFGKFASVTGLLI